MRSRFRSAAADPSAVAPTLPPNMSDRPPPLPLWSSTSPISRPEAMRWMPMTIAVSTCSPGGWPPARLDDRVDGGEVARHRMPDVTGSEVRILLHAGGGVDAAGLELGLPPAAGAEPAPAGRVDRVRRIAREDDALSLPLLDRIGDRH